MKSTNTGSPDHPFDGPGRLHNVGAGCESRSALMATDEPGRGQHSARCCTGADQLSGFENQNRCLKCRLDDCRRALQLALLGIDEGMAKTHDTDPLRDIGGELTQAETYVVGALQVTVFGPNRLHPHWDGRWKA